MSRAYFFLIMLLLILAVGPVLRAQSLLQRTITLEVGRIPLSEVLTLISQQGGFLFSYNSNLIRGDSLVSLSVDRKTVKQTLDALFDRRFEYKETGKHIVIQTPSGGQVWYLSGYVRDERTGEYIRDASVYETHQLAATLTNEQGFFRLRLKDKSSTASIHIRKAWYGDTSVLLKPGFDQVLTVSISPQDILLDTVVISPIEKSWLSHFLLSSRQRTQNINLGKFLADRPYQTSVTPGLGTHGKMSAHVVNKFSFNILGGYTAGLQGIEVGGIFNMVKDNMSFLQIAGVFNMTGGRAAGVQIAGVFNQALDTVAGVQFAGVWNFTTGDLRGVQTSGAFNHASGGIHGMQLSGAINSAPKGMRGMQISGLGNFSGSSAKGMQLSGAANVCASDIKGVQLSGLLNVAKRVNGVQIGVINIADSVEKFNVGLINLIRKGYIKLAISTNESIPVSIALRTGTRKLYNVILAGVHPVAGQRIFTYGYGFGSDLHIRQRWSFVPEVTAQYCYRGNRNAFAMLYRSGFHLNLNLAKRISVFAGPSFSVYHYSADAVGAGYDNPNPFYSTTSEQSPGLRYWFGGNLGIALF